MLILVMVLFSFGCGIHNMGWYYKYFQTEYPNMGEEEEKNDARMRWLFLFIGVCGTIAIFFLRGHRHGWQLTRNK